MIVARRLHHNYLTNTFGDITIFESLVGTLTSVVSLPFKVFYYGHTTTMCKCVIYCEAICYNGKLGVIAYNVQKGAWDDAIHEVPHDNYGNYQLSDIVQCKGYIWIVDGWGYGRLVTCIYVLKLELGIATTTSIHTTSKLVLEKMSNSIDNQVEGIIEPQYGQCWKRVTNLPNDFLDKLKDVWYGEDESSQLVFVTHGGQICIVASKSLILMYNIIHDLWNTSPSFTPWHHKDIKTHGVLILNYGLLLQFKSKMIMLLFWMWVRYHQVYKI